MSYDDERVTEVLERFAKLAPSIRADMVDSIEKRYRKRRSRNIGLSGAAVVAVAAVLAGLVVIAHWTSTPTVGQPAEDGSSHRAAPTIPTGNGNGEWTLPGELPWQSPDKVWPAAVLHIPTKAPDGGKIFPMRMLDSTHVLVESQPKFEAAGAIYSYDLRDGSFRRIVAQIGTPGKTTYLQQFAVSARWIVWSQFDGGHTYDAFKAPRAGGTPVHLASLSDAQSSGLWVASDTTVYLNTDKGIYSMPMTGGTPSPLAGYRDARFVDESGWAVEAKWGNDPMPKGGTYVTTAVHNVFTGQRLTATAPAGTAWMSCGPTFCVGGSNGDNHALTFLQKLDGDDRVTLSTDMPAGVVETYGGTSFYLSFNSDYILDPLSGQSAENPNLRSHATSYSTFDASAGIIGWSIGNGKIDHYISLELAGAS
jgi:hypothetical protein